MKAQQTGIILVTVLLFLFMFSLLAIASLTNSQLQTRMVNNYANRNRLGMAVEAGLIVGQQLISSQAITNPCLQLAPTPQQLFQPWLVGKSCTLSYNNQLVHYTIQRLLTNTCLALGMDNNQQAQFKKGAIFQITAWIAQSAKPVLVLQTTYAKAIDEDCTKPVMEIRPGLLSWREIDEL